MQRLFRGEGRIRTFEGIRRQIYSLLPLATRAPLPFVFVELVFAELDESSGGGCRPPPSTPSGKGIFFWKIFSAEQFTNFPALNFHQRPLAFNPPKK